MGLFGGSSTKIDQAEGHSNASLNSSGWVIGRGNATGGALDSGSGLNLPWYGYMSLAVIGLAWWHYGKRGK